MGELKEKMADDLELRAYRPSTVAIYLRAAERFAEYFRKSPTQMGELEIREYLLHYFEKRNRGPVL